MMHSSKFQAQQIASFAAVLVALSLSACDRIGAIKGHSSPNPLTATPVYDVDREVLFQGSAYYAQAGCAKCHGVQYDGQGPDATATRNDTGLTVPGFQGTTIAPEKTPLAYFKAITVGSEKLTNHSFQGYTDRGRWAMAHFLYSLTTRPLGKDGYKHEEALAKASAEIREAYDGNRRWVMGYKKIEDRPQTPALDELLKLTSVAEDAANTPVDETRKARRDASITGHDAYERSCASCHGLYGEGMASSERFGLIECKDNPLKRQCGVYLSTTDFARSGSLGGLAQFKGAHARLSAESQNMRSFGHLSDDEWQDLLNYARHLAGR